MEVAKTVYDVVYNGKKTFLRSGQRVAGRAIGCASKPEERGALIELTADVVRCMCRGRLCVQRD